MNKVLGMNICEKVLVRSLQRVVFVLFALVALSFVACSEDNEEAPENGSSGEGVVVVTKSPVSVNASSNNIAITFRTEAGYTLQATNPDMLTIEEGATGSGAGNHTARLAISSNPGGVERKSEIFITVQGFSKLKILDIVQSGGANDPVVSWLDKRLSEEYFWLDEYNEKRGSFDYSLNYSKFLSSSLLSLTTNIEDGGIDPNGKRRLYSNVSVISSNGRSTGTRAVAVSGFGVMIAPIILSMQDGGFAFLVEHIYPGSAASTKAVKRGDLITKIGGSSITSSNYNELWNKFFATSGSISFTCLGRGQESATEINITASAYNANPVAHSSILTPPEGVDASAHKVGYVSYLSFDYEFADELKDVFTQFKSDGVTDLIIDLRNNTGGSVEICRIFASMILDSSYNGKLFAQLRRNPLNPYGDTEIFISGDGLSQIGAKSVRIICSINTASSSELLYESLRGLDLPITLVGSTTEGKNCGMDVTDKTINDVTYRFSPITFKSYNAKGENDYADGIEPQVKIADLAANAVNEDVKYYADMFPAPMGAWGDYTRDAALFEALLNIYGKSLLELPANDTEEAASAKMPSMAPVVGEFGTRSGGPKFTKSDLRVKSNDSYMYLFHGEQR